MQKYSLRKKLVILQDSEKWIRHDKGVGLIVVIMIMAFMLSVGLVLIKTTTTGKKVSANVRNQHQAFNAAEAGFDAAKMAIDAFFVDSTWINFDGWTLTEPDNIDLPTTDGITINPNYFRCLTDIQILNKLDVDGDGSSDYGYVLFFKWPYILDESGDLDPRFTYTVFLIDDEASGGTQDANDVLMVCIGTQGTGKNMTTSRLEIEIAIETVI
jgi:hypothetical protein